MLNENQKYHMDRMWRRHMQTLMKRINGIKEKEYLKKYLGDDFHE